MDEDAEIVHTLRKNLEMITEYSRVEVKNSVYLMIGPDFEHFKCDRLSLAAVSCYFDAMFKCDLKKDSISRFSDFKTVTLDQIDATDFKEILRFINKGAVLINDSNVHRLLFLNDFFQLRTPRFKQYCMEYLQKRCQRPTYFSNAFNLISFASSKEESYLFDMLSAHICQRLNHYSNDEQLLKMDFKCINALLKFSKNCIISLPGSENVTLKMINTWVDHDREERDKYRRTLMKNINFSNVSPKYALSTFIAYELRNIVNDVIMDHSDDEDAKSVLLPEVEKFREEVKSDPVIKNKIDGFVTFNVENVLQMKINAMMYSSSEIISNLAWKIGVMRDSNSYFRVYLYCDGTPRAEAWNCCANFIFTLVSHDEEKEDFVRRVRSCKFSSCTNKGKGCKKFIKWEDLINAENEYIEDNSILLYADIYADLPFLLDTETKNFLV